jgi:hypothetical protein
VADVLPGCRSELREEKERCERLETHLATSTREAKSLRYTESVVNLALQKVAFKRKICYMSELNIFKIRTVQYAARRSSSVPK